MAAPIPTTEPLEIFAGDSLAWTKTLADYPASTWTLTYRLLSQQGAAAVTVTATASVDDFSVAVTTATSATWTAGEYFLIGYVTSGTSRVQIYSGRFTVKPNPATATFYDGRSYLERILALLEKTIEEGVIRETIEYSIGGVHAKAQTLADVFKARDYIKSALAQEKADDEGIVGQARQVLTKFIN